MTFVAFDVRSRDKRDRMDGVLDARPITNAEYLTGKAIGFVLMAWLLLLLVAFLLQAFGIVTKIFDRPFGDAVERTVVILEPPEPFKNPGLTRVVQGNDISCLYPPTRPNEVGIAAS
jgi:hypothetical protein